VEVQEGAVRFSSHAPSQSADGGPSGAPVFHNFSLEPGEAAGYRVLSILLRRMVVLSVRGSFCLSGV
jgi:hypothetical protein